MITANVLQRVFYIQRDQFSGTAFTIDVDNRQYIISARHLFEDVRDSVEVGIFHSNEWKAINLQLVGHCDKDIDISVLTADNRLSPNLELEPTSNGIILGQDVYFLGFPYGFFGEAGELNRDFPLPFVKKGILSCMQMKKDSPHVLFIDGHNNPGFSGGPVVFIQPDNRNYKVASVISGFRAKQEPIFIGDAPSPQLTYQYNTGIIISYGIDHALQVIKENPTGLEL